jgi:hypothetical protein
MSILSLCSCQIDVKKLYLDKLDKVRSFHLGSAFSILRIPSCRPRQPRTENNLSSFF